MALKGALQNLEVKNSLDIQDKAESEARTKLNSLYESGKGILYRNYTGDYNQDSWLFSARLSRMAFRARDSNPSTDFGERPIT